MAASFHLHVPLLHKFHFLRQTNSTNSTRKSSSTLPKPPFKKFFAAKFNLYEIMGGRGLCNGEKRLQQELKKSVSKEETLQVPTISSSSLEEEEGGGDKVLNVSDDAFEKELLGLTGGFPGGEKGLKKFIQENPPHKKQESSASFGFDQSL